VAHRNLPSQTSQVEDFLRQFAQAPGLAFADVIDARLVQQVFERCQAFAGNSIYTPAVTLSLFVGQAIDPDPSLRQAVSRLLAQRQVQGLPGCSADTGAYCKARQRLPEEVLAELTRAVGSRVLLDAPADWTWRGRDVKVVDGSTLSMPDTAANQAVFPQATTQQPGLGFPIMRCVVLFSLAVGTVLDAAYGPYQGKGTGETALFRTLHRQLDDGDILLADRYFCSYFEIALLQQRGVDAVFRLHQRRHVDFRRGRRLGPADRLVTWVKPARPAWLDEASYDQLPEQLTLRVLRVHVPKHIKNVRSRHLDLVTTLIDPRAFPKKALADLFWQRWHAELDLRSLKCTLQMDVLRGKTPEVVQKEVWAHLLAYNLIRKVIAQAAHSHDLPPRQLSFKGSVQTLLAFAQPLLRCPSTDLAEHLRALFEAIATHRVGNRPGRLEPRRRKRRPKPYPLLRKPRHLARKLEVP
jgi:DDE family transposase